LVYDLKTQNSSKSSEKTVQFYLFRIFCADTRNSSESPLRKPVLVVSVRGNQSLPATEGVELFLPFLIKYAITGLVYELI